MAHNRLAEVPAKVFSHLPLLNSLELEGNNIVYIDPEAFSGLEGNLVSFDRFVLYALVGFDREASVALIWLFSLEHVTVV